VKEEWLAIRSETKRLMRHFIFDDPSSTRLQCRYCKRLFSTQIGLASNLRHYHGTYVVIDFLHNSNYRLTRRKGASFAILVLCARFGALLFL
jgi:hypothetical protein